MKGYVFLEVQMVNDTFLGTREEIALLSSSGFDSVVSNGSNLDFFSSDIFYDQKSLRLFFNIVDITIWSKTKYLLAFECGIHKFIESGSVID